MAIKGITFDNQALLAKDLGATFAGMLSDGILAGANISYAAYTVNIAPGYILIAGRIIQIVTTESVALTRTSGYARIKVIIDLSGTATETEFSQAYFTADYANSVSEFSALTQTDINSGGATYEAEFAIVALGSSAITGITRSIGRVNIVAELDETVLDSAPTSGSNKPVTSNGIHSALAGKSNANHTHSAYLPYTGGTMTGELVASADTNYTTYKVRNIALSTVAGTPTNTGDLLGVYE